MKILAVRMAEVGCFLDGVAVEGFSGALDVLSGANEFGKSTLFAALRAAFTMSHTATGKAPERLRPYAGGAPLVEVDQQQRAVPIDTALQRPDLPSHLHSSEGR